MNMLKNISFLFVLLMAVISYALPVIDMDSNKSLTSKKPSNVNSEKVIPLETLYGFSIDPSGINFIVISNGCTKAEDFHMQTSSTPEGYDVSIFRKKPDRCRRVPMLKQITIPLDQSRKNDHFRILNSIKMKS